MEDLPGENHDGSKITTYRILPQYSSDWFVMATSPAGANATGANRGKRVVKVRDMFLSDSNRPAYPSLLGDGKSAVGKTWISERQWYKESTMAPQVWRRGSMHYSYGPPIHQLWRFMGSGGKFAAQPEWRSYLDLQADGTTAIARSLPNNPSFSALVALGELYNDGVPKMLGASVLRERALRAREAGGEYLNYEFGWKPLLNDVNAIGNTIGAFSRRLQQYTRDSGKCVRRSYHFAPIVDVRTEDRPLNEMIMFGDGIPDIRHQAGLIKNQITHKITRKTWFSGAFTYYAPPEIDVVSKFISNANVLAGTSLLPETLWQLAPWSWAMDWFSNAGDVLHNVSALGQDGLVMRYGYIMEECTHEIYHEVVGNIRHFDGRQEVVTTVHHTVNAGSTLKRRYSATPFGFGLSFGDLNPRQWSIATALGLTNLPSRL